MIKRILTAALETHDLAAAVAALDQDVVFHSPILATTGDEVRGHSVVAKILQTAFACYGMPRNVEEFQNPDGRYIVTFDGSIDGNLKWTPFVRQSEPRLKVSPRGV
jgi:SnoaL-like domain